MPHREVGREARLNVHALWAPANRFDCDLTIERIEALGRVLSAVTNELYAEGNGGPVSPATSVTSTQ